MWFTIPYNGWKVINGDEDIVDEHWDMKVISLLQITYLKNKLYGNLITYIIIIYPISIHVK